MCNRQRLCSASNEAHINICKRECSNIVVIGDINLDIQNMLHVNGMQHMVKEATCFKGVSPSSNVVSSNIYNRLQGVYGI